MRRTILLITAVAMGLLLVFDGGLWPKRSPARLTNPVWAPITRIRSLALIRTIRSRLRVARTPSTLEKVRIG
jgi:hypothetical protein